MTIKHSVYKNKVQLLPEKWTVMIYFPMRVNNRCKQGHSMLMLL